MQPETPTGETPVVTDPKTNANPTPVVDTAVEEANKRAAQAEMRANQLANQLKEKEDAAAAVAAKELEEQNKYKELYEQEKTKREEIETAQEKAQREAAIKAESDKLFSEFPDAVKTLAEEVGLSLQDTDPDVVEAFKAKLDKISGSIKAPKVTANNPSNVTPPAPEVTGQQLHEIMKDPAKFDAYMKQNYKTVQQMTRKSE